MNPESDKPVKARTGPWLWILVLISLLPSIPVVVTLYYVRSDGGGSVFQGGVVATVTAIAMVVGIVFAILSRVDHVATRLDTRAAEDRESHRASMDSSNVTMELHRKQVAEDLGRQQESVEAHRKEVARDRRKHQDSMDKFHREIRRLTERQSRLEGERSS